MNLKQRYRIFSALLAIALALVFALLPGCSGNPAKDQEAASVFAYENYFNELSELIQNTWRDDYIASIELRLDDPEMIVNGETVVIDSEKETAPYLSDNGTIMLPIQALAELLGIEIDSDDRFASVATVEEILLFDAIEADEGRRVILTKPYQMHRLVVKTSDPSVFEQLEGVTHTVSGPDNTYVIQFGDEKAAKTAAEQLKHSREVQLTEPDVLMSIDTNNYRSWGVQHIGADQYKTFLSPVNNLSVVTVAVLDTGVDATHPFLAGRVISGWCYITNNNNPYDMQGHGTHVAGTIAESTHENVRIMPVKVLGDNGAGNMLTAHMGILWAVENGADVINMSLGGAGEHQYIRDAIIYANSKNTVVVVSAGNDNINLGELTRTPACVPEAITVAACDNRNQKAVFSNFGDAVNVSAPGVGIDSSVPGGSYGVKNGTSMATPHVSAAVALLKSDARYADFGPGEMKTLLHTLTDDAGSPGFDAYFGHGVVNLAHLDMADPPPSDDIPVLDEPDDPAVMRYPFTEDELIINDVQLLQSTIYDYAATWGSDIIDFDNGTVHQYYVNIGDGDYQHPDFLQVIQNADSEYVNEVFSNSNGTVGPRGITIGETATERALELLTISHHAAWGGGTQFVTDNGNARIVLLLLDNGDKAIRFDNQNYHRALIIVFENNVATYFSFSEHNVTW